MQSEKSLWIISWGRFLKGTIKIPVISKILIGVIAFTIIEYLGVLDVLFAIPIVVRFYEWLASLRLILPSIIVAIIHICFAACALVVIMTIINYTAMFAIYAIKQVQKLIQKKCE